jgi:hypothetical protein
MAPSLHLPWAAQAAKCIVVVEDGKIAEVWAGDADVGEEYAPDVKLPAGKVVYGLSPRRGTDDKLIDEELARKGLKRVAVVGGKRTVHFVLPPPPHQGIAQMISTHPAFTTAWLEEGQVFAIQQWMNPGPAEMRSLDMTEAQFKQAVLDLREVGDKIARLDREEDDAKRSAALVALLRPDHRWWNDEVKSALRIRSQEAWPAIEALIVDEKHLPMHAELIYLAHQVAKADARGTLKKVLAEETAYFQKLADAGTRYDENEPPFMHHQRRRAAAQWAIDRK